jgi:hypothetical protein
MFSMGGIVMVGGSVWFSDFLPVVFPRIHRFGRIFKREINSTCPKMRSYPLLKGRAIHIFPEFSSYLFLKCGAPYSWRVVLFILKMWGNPPLKCGVVKSLKYGAAHPWTLDLVFHEMRSYLPLKCGAIHLKCGAIDLCVANYAWTVKLSISNMWSY